MAKWTYSDKVKDHFMNPRNILREDNEADFHGIGQTGNVKCGDEMIVYIKVDPDTLTITDCKWRTYGCASAIASTSILSEMVIGMTLDQAYGITAKDILKELGGLPDNKVHCSVLGDKALRAAIDDYYAKNGMEDRIKTQTAKIVCECMQVTDEDIEHAVLEGARSFSRTAGHDQDRHRLRGMSGKRPGRHVRLHPETLRPLAGPVKEGIMKILAFGATGFVGAHLCGPPSRRTRPRGDRGRPFRKGQGSASRMRCAWSRPIRPPGPWQELVAGTRRGDQPGRHAGHDPLERGRQGRASCNRRVQSTRLHSGRPVSRHGQDPALRQRRGLLRRRRRP